jgi:Transposase DDE domain group 1
MGEARRKALAVAAGCAGSIAVDTFAGRVHVEWDPAAAVTPLGQVPFFIEFLKVSGLFDAWVEDCPLRYDSPNAPDKRQVLVTLLLSILAGHHRYAHISAIRHDRINAELFGVERLLSEDAVRRALKRIEETAGIAWLDRHLARTTEALLGVPWVMDLDSTVKCLYGKQQAAEVGYNPRKPGRPSHCYHTALMANTRLALSVQVQAGNRTAARYGMQALWPWLDRLPAAHRPALIRGDVAFGNEALLREAEARNQPYLTKLRLTATVKRTIRKLFAEERWVDAGQGWEGLEQPLQLSGWSRRRRVIILRRVVREQLLLKAKDPQQDWLAFIEPNVACAHYAYAVLVTSLRHEILSVAQLYRDRGDAENYFDELKNHWGWAGFTTQDLARCRLMAHMVALIYNWWTLFVRLANPNKHHEAITSRPLLLHGVGMQTRHAQQRRVTITSTHAKTSAVQACLASVARFLSSLRETAEQLTDAQRLRAIVHRAFSKFLSRLTPAPGLPPPAAAPG